MTSLVTVTLFYVCLGYVLCQDNATEHKTISSEKRPPSISVLPLPIKPFSFGTSRPNRPMRHRPPSYRPPPPPSTPVCTSSSSSEKPSSEEITSTTSESLETVSPTEPPETTTTTTIDSPSPARPQPPLPPVPPTPPPIPDPNYISIIDKNQVSTQRPLPTPPPKPPSRPTRPIYRPPTPPTYKPTVALLYHINLRDEQGGYLIDFLTANSVYRMEKGYFKDDPNDEVHKIMVKTGAYGFTSPEGVNFRVDFIADENGFRAYESRPT